MTEVTAPSGPSGLREVLDAFTSGALTVDDIARRTRLDRELVRVAIDQLVSLGLITSEQTSTSCPETACGGCSAPTGNGCATGGAAQRGGLVTLTLGRRPGL
jgi:hypothetical protein